MIIASRFVIKEILLTMETGDLVEGEDIFKKFHRRYRRDIELKKIYNKFEDYLASMDDNKLKELKSDLKKLEKSRRLHTSGGKDYLHFRSRRPAGYDWITLK